MLLRSAMNSKAFHNRAPDIVGDKFQISAAFVKNYIANRILRLVLPITRTDFVIQWRLLLIQTTSDHRQKGYSLNQYFKTNEATGTILKPAGQTIAFSMQRRFLRKSCDYNEMRRIDLAICMADIV